ncbi:hypothetical protein CTAM01_09168 [Colletotrichum tamarilloi]|uniref:Uncharacterized protein n=1 Tax=Colletotrichum tamarilloi TaxID=1209934 RepID=A0ABQ9R3W9_9PEZI|nr:uncharacterized protein CTAM01_09168 [Colletotrichum tamarilloi]KAK1493977.1 hypothetical protein CTAM01_09168 [Colletotrichum tamarilloi]
MEDDAKKKKKKTITTIRSRHQPRACEKKGVYGVASRVHNYAQGVSVRTDESRPTGDGEPKGDKPQGPPPPEEPTEKTTSRNCPARNPLDGRQNCSLGARTWRYVVRIGARARPFFEAEATVIPR